MIMCLDVGNSQVYGGVFSEDKIILRFRRNSKTGASSDEIGIFLRTILRENDIDPTAIEQISICTVVPEALHSIKNACMKYFKLTPFVLQAGVKTGLKVRYKNPLEVGADRIANAIAGSQLYPQQNLLIIDFGTATTFCAISSEKDYLGGVILAGLKISMEALESRTSKLPAVEIVKPESCLGKNTIESIQSGLYFGTLGQVKEISERIIQEGFAGKRPKLIGTGGFASLFNKSEIFDEESPDLVLHGLYHALKMNS